MEPVEFTPVYAEKYTNDQSPTFNVPRRSLGGLDSAIRYGVVNGALAPGYYQDGTENTIIILKSGYYKVDFTIEITEEKKTEEFEIYASIVVGGVKQNDTFEIQEILTTETPRTLHMSDVIRINANDPLASRAVGVGFAWEGAGGGANDLPFKVNFWKYSIERVMNFI